MHQGWLDAVDLAPAPGLDAQRVNFAAMVPFRMERLARAAARLAAVATPNSARPLQRSSPHNGSWLDDYALFMALCEANDWRDWCDWSPALAARQPAALAVARAEHADRIHFWQFCQWAFFRQWLALKAYANDRGVRDRRRRADLHRPPERRRVGAPEAVRAGARRPAHRGGRRAAGLLQRHRPALGQPAVPLERARQGRLRLVGGARAPHLRAGGHRAHRPLPRLCRLLGNPGQRAHGRQGPLGAGARASRCSRPSPRRWGRCPSSPRTWA